ncbi:MAG TPA: hypothetical protein VF648_00585 [Pyrinomonadaceae bacterium]|jgi:hypothetical protein
MPRRKTTTATQQGENNAPQNPAGNQQQNNTSPSANKQSTVGEAGAEQQNENTPNESAAGANNSSPVAPVPAIVQPPTVEQPSEIEQSATAAIPQTGTENGQKDQVAGQENSAPENAVETESQTSETPSASDGENDDAESADSNAGEKPPVERDGSNIKSGVIGGKILAPGFCGFFGKLFFDDNGVLADAENPQIKGGVTVYPALIVSEDAANEIRGKFARRGFTTKIEFLD